MQWKIINEFPIYEISNTGIVRNKITGCIRKVVKNKRGYSKILLCYNQRKRNEFLHRLVATHFICERPFMHEVNHKDSDKDNNNVYNLEWITHKQNMEHYKMAKKLRAGLTNNG
jgi:hypothetical protein